MRGTTGASSANVPTTPNIDGSGTWCPGSTKSRARPGAPAESTSIGSDPPLHVVPAPFRHEYTVPRARSATTPTRSSSPCIRAIDEPAPTNRVA